MNRPRSIVLGFLVFFLTYAAVAQATPLKVSASGVWGVLAPASLWTAPGAPWELSFFVDSHPSVVPTATGFSPVFSDFSYSLGGSAVATTPSGGIAFDVMETLIVEFGGATGFQLFGPQAFSGLNTAPTILPGTYIAAKQPGTVIPYFELGGSAVQNLTGTPITISEVPEPSTWGLAGTGILVLGIVAWRRTRLRAAIGFGIE